MAFVEGEDDVGGAADDLTPVDGAKITGVEAVVAVVAHHEVLAGGNGHGAEGALGGDALQGHDGVGVAGELFGGEKGVVMLGAGEAAGNFRGGGGIIHGLAVDEKVVVAQFHGVAGQADDAFDEAGAVLGRIKDRDVAALGVGPLGEVEGGEGDFEVVGEFVHEDAVADEDGGFHGTGGDVVPIREGGADGEEDDSEDEEGTDFLGPPAAGDRPAFVNIHGHWTGGEAGCSIRGRGGSF